MKVTCAQRELNQIHVGVLCLGQAKVKGVPKIVNARWKNGKMSQI